MMQFHQSVSLKPYNTFGIDQKAAWFAELQREEDFEEVRHFLREKSVPLLILGGGSNVLLTEDFEGLVLRNSLKGFSTLEENEEYAVVSAGAGEVWHSFVLETIQKDLAGLENLSLIPGCVGAAPMQNIGAYGVEIKDTFHHLEAIHIETGEKKTFSIEECSFGYRESVFKRELKGKYLITSVSFRLSRKPDFKTSYGAIQDELKRMGVTSLTLEAVSKAVINIRSSKLPDPAQIGNAGSFFKNPVVDHTTALKLKEKFPDMPQYPSGESNKLAAGWLIEKCGLKGFTVDNRYGVHKNQALVLVNYHDATGKEIYELSTRIISDVQRKFGVTLEREVNIIPERVPVG